MYRCAIRANSGCACGVIVIMQSLELISIKSFMMASRYRAFDTFRNGTCIETQDIVNDEALTSS